MTDALRDELLRMGEAAPPAVVPRDVWDRGRRARRRDRVVAGGAVLSVLVALGGLGVLLAGPGRHEAPPVSSRSEAVPSVIEGVPNRLGQFVEGGSDESWEAKVAEKDLAVGRASVAFAATSGDQALPVVITADDGRYHLLDLPGWLGTSLAAYQAGTTGLALSPDGRQLAWGWYDRSTLAHDAVSAGVRVADLASGGVRTIPLSGARGVAVASLRWSSDSRWLVWQGMELKRWDEGHTSWKRNVAGRIPPSAVTSEPIGVSRGGSEQLAIDDRGSVSWTLGGAWRVEDRAGRVDEVADVLAGASAQMRAGVVSPGGRSVALADDEPTSWAHFLASAEDVGLAPWARTLDVRRIELPGDRRPATVQPVGWIDEGHVVELVTPVHPLDESSWTTGDSELAVLSLHDGDRPAYDVVAHVKQGDEQTGTVQGITVAVDLMSLDQPTRDFPAPEWPWSDERKVAVYGGIGVALLAAVVFGLAYRRGRRLL